ncbi:hypothetical protein ACN20G_28295 (plasmid) [Streptomyces sp. BI20]|uniref:hypothetical protein n=1 Tax=Streptomyces sp. BI20 TaxID=3403460 RepID=UPI003C749CBD
MAIRMIRLDGTAESADLVRDSIRHALVGHVLAAALELNHRYLVEEFYEPGADYEPDTWREIAAGACHLLTETGGPNTLTRAQPLLADTAGSTGAMVLLMSHVAAATTGAPENGAPVDVWDRIVSEHQQARVVAQLLALVSFVVHNKPERTRALSAALAQAAAVVMPDGTDAALRARTAPADGEQQQ